MDRAPSRRLRVRWLLLLAGALLCAPLVGRAAEDDEDSGPGVVFGGGYLQLSREAKMARLGFGTSMIRMTTERRAPEEPELGGGDIAGSLAHMAERSEHFRLAEEAYRRTLTQLDPEERVDRERERSRELKPGAREEAWEGEVEPEPVAPPPARPRPAPALAREEIRGPDEFGGSLEALVASVETLAPSLPDHTAVATDRIAGPEDLEARAERLLREVESPTSTWADEDLAGSGAEEPADEGGSTDPIGDILKGIEVRVDRRVVIRQNASVGYRDDRYSSVSEGNTTTESRFVQHVIELERAFGRDRDLALRNELRIDTLRDRDQLDATYSRQFGPDGHAQASGSLLVSQHKSGGDAEPDYLEWEGSLSGGRDPFTNFGWEARLHTRGQKYGDPDAFYLDSDAWGFEGVARYAEQGASADFRLNLDRERYPGFAENDVDRLRQEWLIVIPWRRVDFQYLSTFQRESVLFPGLLDSYREWYQELTAARRISPVFTLELAWLWQSRHVDEVSAFLFDVQEEGERRRLSFQFPGVMDGTLTLTTRRSLFRDKDATDAVNEAAEDQERRDWDLYLHRGAGKLDASLSFYLGDIAYLRGSSSFFSDQERWGLSLASGWSFDNAWRADVTVTWDDEAYPTNPSSDNDAFSLGFQGTYSF